MGKFFQPELLVREVEIDQEVVEDIGADQAIFIGDAASIHYPDGTVLKLQSADLDRRSHRDVAAISAFVANSTNGSVRQAGEAGLFSHTAVDKNSACSGVQQEPGIVIANRHF